MMTSSLFLAPYQSKEAFGSRRGKGMRAGRAAGHAAAEAAAAPRGAMPGARRRPRPELAPRGPPAATSASSGCTIVSSFSRVFSIVYGRGQPDGPLGQQGGSTRRAAGLSAGLAASGRNATCPSRSPVLSTRSTRSKGRGQRRIHH